MNLAPGQRHPVKQGPPFDPRSLLAACVVCGGKVSLMAKACPTCGHPGRKPESVSEITGKAVGTVMLLLIALGVLVMLVAAISGPGS